MRVIVGLCWAFFIGCGSYLGHTYLVFEVARHHMPEMSRQDWAAWVQAVGSIGAILATIGVMTKQNEHNMKLADLADQRDFRRKISAIKGIIVRASEIAERSRMMINEQIKEERNAVNKIYASAAAKALAESMRALSEIPVHELGSYDLTVSVIEMRESLFNFHSFCERVHELWETTSTDDVLEMARILGQTRKDVSMRALSECDRLLGL